MFSSILKVAQLMQTEVRTVHCDATIADAIVTLADRRVSALPEETPVRETAP